MQRTLRTLTVPAAALTLAVLAVAAATRASGTSPPLRFADAELIVEVNATDGDAGLQLFADAGPWRRFELYKPDGSKILDVTASGDLRDYGLTELFSESSEPPFTEFPLSQFKELWPEGRYRFRGETVEGQDLVGSVVLSHDIPAGPRITSPREDSVVGTEDLEVRWQGVPEPAGIDVAGYQVLVIDEDRGRELAVDLGPGARRLEVPEQFVRPETEYKVEVLAIDDSGNQTLTELIFRTA